MTKVCKNHPKTLHELKQSIRVGPMGIAGNAVVNFTRGVESPKKLI